MTMKAILPYMMLPLLPLIQQKFNENDSAVQDADILVPEMKANDDDADLLVAEMNSSGNGVLADKKEANSRKSIVKDLKVDQYRKLRGEEHATRV
jgi:hypothetical protein